MSEPEPQPPAEPKQQPTEPAAPAVALTADDAIRLAEHLRTEIRRARRGVIMTYSLGIFASLAMAIYMGFILFSVKTALEPTTLALVITDTAGERIPAMIEMTETALIENADDFADDLSSQFLELVPRLSEEGQRALEFAHSETIPEFRSHIEAYIKDYISENEEELRAFAEEHDNEQFAQFVVEAVIQETERELNNLLSAQYEGRDVDYFHENLSLSLMAMNEALSELLNKEPDELTRREKLQRNILARLFVAMVNVDREKEGSDLTIGE